MEKLFLPIYHFFSKHKALLFICLAAAFLCTGYFASKIELEEDISAMLPKDEKTEKLAQVFQNSKFLDRLVFTISLTDTSLTNPDSLIAYTESFIEKAQQLQPYISQIDDKVNDAIMMDMFSNIQNNLPIYLSENDYKEIDSLTSTARLKEALEQNIRTLSSPAGLALKNMIATDPAGISFIALKKLQQLQFDENYELYDGYILTKDRKHLLYFISPLYPPNNTAKNSVLLAGIDSITDSFRNNGFGNIEANYFGSTAVSVGNAQQIRKDNLLTQSIAVLFIIVFIAWYFRKVTAPIIMLLPVIFGALFSLSIIYFIKGKISVIALGTGSVVLGIAINYSLHVFNHYRHTRNMRVVLQDLSMPMTIGSFTTIGGFLCLQFVESALLKDIGLFAAFSLVGASLFSLIFLPHLIANKKQEQQLVKEEHSWLDKVAQLKPEKNKWLIIGIVLLTILFGYTTQFAGFESDMLRMNYMSPKLKNAEHELNKINTDALQSMYIIATGNSLDDALQKNELAVNKIDSLKANSVIKKSAGLSSVALSKVLQQERINRWNAYWTEEKKKEVLGTLLTEGQKLGYKKTAFENFTQLLTKHYSPVETVLDSSANNTLIKDYIIQNKRGETQVINLVKTTPENKTSIYKVFDNNSSITVTDKQYLTNKLVAVVNTDFNKIAWMSSLLVFFVLLISYGRMELALATFIPMLITWIWILGIMGLAGIQFNIINIIISTLIFGLGDDYSIFIMDGLLQEYQTGKKLLGSYKSSIFLSAITTIAGLGVLIFAKHPALRSIALISIIGMFCVVLLSQILIPLFFNFLIKNRVQKKLFPWTLFGLLRSAFAFTYFLIGCLILTIAGFFLIKINVINKQKGKLIYHTILSKFTWSLLYIMGNLTKRIINPLKERFDKPAVVIANHQSFLDILVTTMLHPKLVLLTNKWVWSSPFFGNVVRMADYYPVADGVEQGTDRLAESVKNGYSIVIFPEGTRTYDGTMKRFHKGAFYLAEQLNLDILPIVIHGTGYNMSKSDFLLKSGTITLQFLPRIKPSEIQWGNGHAARTKSISTYFKTAYKQLRTEIETPVYFKEQIIYNYLYKGPVLEWYMRVKLKLENYYTRFNSLVPTDAKVLDIGCGYGFLSYMLHFTSEDRSITGIDYDENKIATAKHCFGRGEKLGFAYSDVMSFNFEMYDCIIMSDILHYLKPTQQTEAIIKCINHLQPGGTIIIRDGNAELEKRHKGTKLTELFSTTVFGFNKTTDSGLSFISGNTIKSIALDYNLECTELDETRLTSNVIYILKKNS
jgi:1-acyl-sn-glycerol-3-phosphate acyltransferase